MPNPPKAQPSGLSSMPAGKYFHAAAHPDLQQTRPTVVFVPNDLIREDGSLDMDTYKSQRWHSINAGASHHAVGSHLFPDMEKPANEASEMVTSLKVALRRYLQKSMGKPSKPRLPGKAGTDMEM